MRLAALALLAATAWAGPRTADPAVAARAARRQALAEHLGADYALVIGQPQTDVLNPRQEGHFLYLTGVEDPGAFLLLGGPRARALTLTRKSGVLSAREVLFLAESGDQYAQFFGLRHRPDPFTTEALAVESTWVAPQRLDRIAALMAQVLPKRARLHVSLYRSRDQTLVREIRRAIVDRLAKERKDVKIVGLDRWLSAKRSIKEDDEVARLEQAIGITHAAFRDAIPRIRAGSSEANVDAALLESVRRRGARPAYPFVVGAGANAPIPHYFRNADPLLSGDLLVIDAGASVDRYAADITRTFPVSGRFTPRQREVYEVVLEAQTQAIKAVRPGATFAQVHKVAHDIIATAGFRQYFIHGTSHHVGLDVHDPGPAILKPGMTITVEPGIYIREERIGIRIEDIVLVTADGHRVLGAPFPKTIAEVEALLAR
ncbi:MAG: aminopeptidase P N-terminal domain-containing protein [Planctomycetota bacterium]|jgi:Xaa-Pro aminopeptidase